jgi:PAS fold
MTAPASPAAPSRFLPDDLGRFCWTIVCGTAVWADSVYQLHGYRPGQIPASMALTFDHKHPEDLHSCVDAVHAGMLAGRVIVHEHRLIDARGQVQPVVLVARPVKDARGRVLDLCGFLLPTNTNLGPAGDPTSLRGGASLIPLLMNAFQVSRATARVLLAARRPLTARRTPQQQALARAYTGTDYGSDLRRTFEDSMFPLDHLTLEPIELAA